MEVQVLSAAQIFLWYYSDNTSKSAVHLKYRKKERDNMTGSNWLTTFLSVNFEGGCICYLRVEFEGKVTVLNGPSDEIGKIIRIARRHKKEKILSLIKRDLKKRILIEQGNLIGAYEITTINI